MGYSTKITINCNKGCKYCYESVSRQENRHVGKQADYDISKVLEFVEKTPMGASPNIHGGEPLLVPKAKNEELLKAFYEKFKETSIQTNGDLIDADYIRMFKEYNTTVGVSIDGHEELNDGRWMGSVEKTRKSTANIINNIRWMRSEGIKVSIISVINKHNGTKDKLPKLKEFLLMMQEIGITGGRLNMIELDYPELADELEIPMDEEIYFYQEMAPFLRENNLRYAPFTDVVDALLGYGYRTCVNTQCDPYHTLGEQPIYGDGTVGNCLRTTKDGLVFLAENNDNGQRRVSNERYSILRQIPMEEGGCGGCRFFSICNAHCPGSAEDGDWRNRSQHCESLYALYEATERDYKRMLPNLTLTSEPQGMPDHILFKNISDGSASEQVFAKMNTKNEKRNGKRGAF